MKSKLETEKKNEIQMSVGSEKVILINNFKQKDPLIKKLDFDMDSLGSKSSKETVRVSEALIKNPNTFISHVFKTEFLISDKNSYYVSIDSEVLKVFCQITKLIKINNCYNINSPTDFSILQLMLLEHNFKISYSQRDIYLQEMKHLEEKINSKDEELNFLRERIKIYEKTQSNEDQYEMFEKEINNIRNKLLSKTSDFLNFENYHNQVIQENKEKINEITQFQQLIVNENIKLKAKILELISAFKKGDENEMYLVLNYFAENVSEFEENNNIAEKISEEREKLSKSCSENTKNPEFESKENNKEIEILNKQELKNDNRYISKVIGEFDKILSEELKKVEKFYKREDIKEKRKSISASEKRKSVNRSSEIRNRSSISNWSESLREQPEKFAEDFFHRKVDLDSLTNSTKMKIRTSLKNENKKFDLSRSPNKNEIFSKTAIDSFQNGNNLSKIYENNIGKNYSPLNKDLNVKKIIKKEDVNRE